MAEKLFCRPASQSRAVTLPVPLLDGHGASGGGSASQVPMPESPLSVPSTSRAQGEVATSSAVSELKDLLLFVCQRLSSLESQVSDLVWTQRMAEVIDDHSESARTSPKRLWLVVLESDDKEASVASPVDFEVGDDERSSLMIPHCPLTFLWSSLLCTPAGTAVSTCLLRLGWSMMGWTRVSRGRRCTGPLMSQ